MNEEMLPMVICPAQKSSAPNTLTSASERLLMKLTSGPTTLPSYSLW